MQDEADLEMQLRKAQAKAKLLGLTQPNMDQITAKNGTAGE